ncbi:hypothetical protein [Agromyces mangrovi Wang et al. 2018]|uniref:hypothetical protein n=1 Tax=Agromyces mangrovi TaxID=1858653 RepID=UPI0025726D6E|nr:hypothetical protein [Agromyces mangrovi]
MVTAFIDESQLGGTGSGLRFMLTATIPFSADCDPMREELLRLLPKNRSKLHWNESVASARRDLIDMIGRLDLMHWIVYQDSTAGESPERVRRSCIEMLAWELQGLQLVDAAMFESRGPADDNRDRRMFDALRSRRVLQSPLKVDHLPGPEEAMLWIPDAVSGAVNERDRGDESYFETLRHQIQLVPTNKGY